MLARKVSMSDFFEFLAAWEDPVTFKCFSQMESKDKRGFAAYDDHGNQIGSAYQDGPTFVFYLA